MNTVTIYANGGVSCSVCAPADIGVEELTRAVNLLNPSGTRHGWTLSEDATFADGRPMPGPCDHDQARRHYLFHC